MDREKVLKALEDGEFDGIEHHYQPYEGWKKGSYYQISIKVIGGIIEHTQTYTSKFFNGKENEKIKDVTEKHLVGKEALEFIESRPYFFKQRRPDLFD